MAVLVEYTSKRVATYRGVFQELPHKTFTSYMRREDMLKSIKFTFHCENKFVFAPVKVQCCILRPFTLKYDKDETPEVSGYFDLNQFVDITLNTVFAHAGERRLIFSSFDPDTCIMLRLKQNKYPVLFLTQADTKVWTPYADLRTRTLSMAKNLARAHNLLGVDVYTEVLLRDMSSIEKIKEAGLVLFCWGEDNNDSNMLNSLKDAKVDGIIYDRIDFYKTTKESIFKIEKKAKVKLFHQFSGATVIAPELTDSGGESS